MSDAYIIDAVRTPRGIGKVGKGSLAHLHPQHPARTVLAALAKRNDLNTAEVDDIIWGTSSQRGAQGGDPGAAVIEVSDAGVTPTEPVAGKGGALGGAWLLLAASPASSNHAHAIPDLPDLRRHGPVDQPACRLRRRAG